MSTTYTWRPSGGNYFSSSGSSASAANHFYYSSNRAFRMDFNAPGLDKSTLYNPIWGHLPDVVA